MTEPTDAELRAAFGPRADYYLSQARGNARRLSNRAAFFLSGLWLPFRRMYRITAIFYAAVLVELVLEELFFRALGYPSVPRWADRIGSLLPAVACGLFGNGWYVAHARRVVAQTRKLDLPEADHLQELARRGGTRAWHAAGMAVLFMLVLTLVAVATELLLEPDATVTIE